jgi:di/tricarboxylate transporter
MPMAFGSLIGGLVTLVGTSPNILVSRVRAELLGVPFGMFDFAPVGLGVVVAGLAFLAVGWRLLPGERRAQASAAAAFEVQPYVFEAVLPATSPWVKKTVADLEAIGEGNVAVAAIVRGKDTRYIPAKHSTLLADDILALQGDPHTLRTIIEECRLDLGDNAAGPATDKRRANLGVVEAVVMRNSPLVGCASTELKLRDRYNISLIGISRQG